MKYLLATVLVAGALPLWAAQPPAWTTKPEQIAAARQLAADLNIVLKENAAGQIVLLDTAAKRSWVDDFQMQEVLVFPQLESLTVEGPSISDALAPRIARHTALISLAMRNTLISDEGIAQLKPLKSLKIIDLRLSPLVTDKSASVLASIESLKAVRVSGVNLTDTGLEALLKLPELSEVDVRNCRGVTQAGIQQLSVKQSLRTLKIGGLQIGDDVLKVVSKMSQLAGLSLDNCDISDTGVARLGSLPLQDFTIYQSGQVTDEGLAVLASFDNLKSLTLRDIPARCASLQRLPHPEKLRQLNVAQSGITDDDARVLGRFTGIEKLIVSETALSDAVIETLARLTSLKYLEMTQTQISAAGVKQLQAALPDCSIRSN